MKVRDIIKRIEQFKHPAKPGRGTVAGQTGYDLPTGAVRSIFKQAQIEEK